MSIEGKKMLLSGASGYLGSRLSTALSTKGALISHIRHACSPSSASEEACTYQRAADLPPAQFDVFIHCATCYGRRDESFETIQAANVFFPVEILEQIASDSILFVNIDTALPAETSDYARSKHEFVARLRTHFSHVRILNIKLEQYFGPGDNSIISRMLHSLREQRVLALTPGEQKRDFIFIEDVVSAILLLLNHGQPEAAGLLEVPLGSGTAVSLQEIARLMLEAGLGESTYFDWGGIPFRKNEVMHSCADLSYLNALGWKPEFSLKEGIRAMSLER